MSKYNYTQLSLPTCIRLLRLLPSAKDEQNLRCELLEYPIQSSDTVFHPYEALSYVWGSEDKPKSIIVANQYLNITQSLYTALLRLQNHTCPRIVWVDAICINQANNKEKESQIPLMAEVYAKATRVVVWLGEIEDDSNEALNAIRVTAENSTSLSKTQLPVQAVSTLLERSWFSRVWVRAYINLQCWLKYFN